MISSMASRRGEGVIPVPPGECGSGDPPRDMVGYTWFIESAGEGVLGVEAAL